MYKKPAQLIPVAIGGGSVGLGVDFLLNFFIQRHSIWLLLLGLLLFGTGISILILNDRFQQKWFWKYSVGLAFIILMTIFIATLWSTANYGHLM